MNMDSGDVNLINSGSISLDLVFAPVQSGEDSEMAELRACSDMCRSNGFVEKESQVTQNATPEHDVEPGSSWLPFITSFRHYNSIITRSALRTQQGTQKKEQRF